VGGDFFSCFYINPMEAVVKKHYDLIIVGGGPAGLMAARVAGENGINTALLERKT
jgi:NADPH-dependent 2,4-dienoyl-CoA reductase/sulfur reductase-like enzyme